MAGIIVETGAIVAGANSFVQASDVLAWATDRGLDFTSGAVADQTSAVIRAGDYLRNEDRFLWRGKRVADTQNMSWPRSGAVVLFGTGIPLASNVIPQALKDAQCQLAIKALVVVLAGTDLEPDLDRGGMIDSVSVSRGLFVKYANDAMNETLIQVSNGILKPFLRRTKNFPLAPYMQQDLRTYSDTSSPLANQDINTGYGEAGGNSDAPSPALPTAKA